MTWDAWIAVIRDILLILYLVLGIVISLVLLMVILSIYRKLGPVLKAMQNTANNVQTTAVMFSDLAIKPLIGVTSFVAGVRQGLQVLSWVKGRRKGRR
jgi:hypothetical protein